MSLVCANEKIHGLVSLANINRAGLIDLSMTLPTLPWTKVQGDLSPIARQYSFDKFACVGTGEQSVSQQQPL